VVERVAVATGDGFGGFITASVTEYIGLVVGVLL